MHRIRCFLENGDDMHISCDGDGGDCVERVGEGGVQGVASLCSLLTSSLGGVEGASAITATAFLLVPFLPYK